jgi:hypothetical protein
MHWYDGRKPRHSFTERKKAMMLKSGDKIHVVHRQLFDKDVRRHFIGVIEACEGSLIRAVGYLYAADRKSNKFVPYPPVRTRIISIDSGVIVNLLPDNVQIDQIQYQYPAPGEVTVTDGTWSMELSHL